MLRVVQRAAPPATPPRGYAALCAACGPACLPATQRANTRPPWFPDSPSVAQNPGSPKRTRNDHHAGVGRAQAGVTERVQAVVGGSRARLARSALQVEAVVVYEAHNCHGHLHLGTWHGKQVQLLWIANTQ